MARPRATINSPGAPSAISGKPQPVSSPHEDLIRRAMARRAMGRGGTATYARLGKTPPKVVRTKPQAPPPPQAPQGITEKALLDAMAQMQFGGQRSALNQQLQQNARFSSGTPDWYAQAVKEIQGLKAQGQQQSAQTLAQIQNYNSPPTLPNNPVDQQAAQARNNLNAEFAAQFGQNANSNSAAMDRTAAALVTQQGNTLNQANAQRQGLLGQQADLAANEGAFRVTQLAGMRADQQRAMLDQAKLATQQLRDQAAIAIQQGNLDLARQRLEQADAIYKNLTLPNAQADNARADAAAGTTAANQRANRRQKVADFQSTHGGYTPQQWRGFAPQRQQQILGDLTKRGLPVPSGGKTAPLPKVVKPKPLSANEQKTRQGILDVKSQYDRQIAAGVPLHEIAADARKHGVSEAILAAGADLATKGYVTPGNVKRLRDIGVRVPKDWTS